MSELESTNDSLGACDQLEFVIGCDFGAPLTAGGQAKKTIAIEARRLRERCYEIVPAGRNERLVRETDRTRSWSVNRRGWVISDLARSIATDEAVVVLALDFPFSIPECLLQDVLFAARVSADVFATRSNWAKFVQSSINLEFDSTSASAKLRVDPNLTNWRDKAFWRKRATDVATRGQPPLKDKFQNLFNMTLIGAALLGALSEGGMQITLHPGEASYWLKRSVIETYPGAVARAIGFKGDYKKSEFAASLHESVGR